MPRGRCVACCANGRATILPLPGGQYVFSVGPPARSAGFQPAVSQCFQPASLPFCGARDAYSALPIGRRRAAAALWRAAEAENRRYSRLETCATLNRYPGARITCASGRLATVWMGTLTV